MIAGGTLAICAGAALNILLSQPQEQTSDLTLANIETFAVPCKESIEMDGKFITVTVCDRTTSIWDAILNTPCGSEAEGPCSFSNVGKI